MKKRLVALLLGAAMTASLVAGCGSSSSSSSSSAGSSSSASSTASASSASGEAASGDKITITIATDYLENNTESVATNFNAALASAKEYFADKYNIESEAYAIESYKEKIRNLVAADEQPDIFMVWGAGFMSSFVDAGKVAAIDDYISDEAASEIQDGSLDMFTFDDKTYGLTSSKWVGSLYCNTALFDEYGLELPTTYDELLDVCAAFRENGVQPIALGAKDQWPCQQYINEFTIQLAGAEETNKMVFKETSVDNEYVAQATDYVIEMINAGCFNDNFMGLSNEEAYASFTRGECAMMYTNSNYSSQAYEEGSAVADSITAIRFPLLSDAVTSTDYFGGSIDGLCMSANCEYPEETYEVMEYITREWARNTGVLSTWDLDDLAESYEVDTVIADFSSDATGYALAWDTLYDSNDAQTWLDLVSEVYSGNITEGSDFAAQLQAAVAEE